jgi:DNA polymerase-3 subunit gamma/tau
MSYVVLARKWRPKRFKELVGQEYIATTLLNSIRSERTAHAYLFVGPRGVGKTSAARIFATALNCPEAVDGEPCGECDVCREIAIGRSLDVIEIDGASNNGVDDIRTLRENVKIAPASLRYKVYIIDEVHMLSTGAFNAFLKTLEEPPDHVKFIMATTEAQKIPATVLSRCQRFDFRRLTSRQIAGRLKTIVEAESIKVDDGALFSVARAAGGSMRDAQSILDQLVSFSDSEITQADVHAMLGTVGQDIYRRIAVSIADLDAFTMLKTIDEIVERGKDLAQFLKELTIYFRNLLIAGFGGGEDLIDLSEEDLAELKKLSGRFDSAVLLRIVEDLSDLESRFRQLPSTRVALEMLLMRMAQTGGDVSIDSLISKLTSLERRLNASGAASAASANPAPPSNPAGNPHGASYVKEPEASQQSAPEPESAPTPPPPEPAAEDYENLEDDPPEPPEPEESEKQDEGAEPQQALWDQFLAAVREQRMSTYSFLSNGRFCGIENDQAIVGFDPENSYSKKHLEEKAVKQLLEETLKTITGKPTRIKLIIESDRAGVGAPANKGKPKREQRKEADEAKKRQFEQALQDPIVKKTVELFNGKIVYVSG